MSGGPLLVIVSVSGLGAPAIGLMKHTSSKSKQVDSLSPKRRQPTEQAEPAPNPAHLFLCCAEQRYVFAPPVAGYRDIHVFISDISAGTRLRLCLQQ